MSIIYDLKAINQAMQSLQPVKAGRSNGRFICHECYIYLGPVIADTVVECLECGAINRVEE